MIARTIGALVGMVIIILLRLVAKALDLDPIVTSINFLIVLLVGKDFEDSVGKTK